MHSLSSGYVALDDDATVASDSLEHDFSEYVEDIDQEIEGDDETSMVHETKESLSLLRKHKQRKSNSMKKIDKV